MDTERHKLETGYAAAVEQESAAWRELQRHEPGTPGRSGAWKSWTDAIWATNRAWRRLNENRVTHQDHAVQQDHDTQPDALRGQDLSRRGGEAHAGA